MKSTPSFPKADGEAFELVIPPGVFFAAKQLLVSNARVTVLAWTVEPAEHSALPRWVRDLFTQGHLEWCPTGEGIYVHTDKVGHDLYTLGGVLTATAERYATLQMFEPARFWAMVDEAKKQTRFPTPPPPSLGDQFVLPLLDHPERLNELLKRINESSREVNSYELGLPTYDEGRMAMLREIVLHWIREQRP